MSRRALIFQPRSGTPGGDASESGLEDTAAKQSWTVLDTTADRRTLWRRIEAGEADVLMVPSLSALGGDVSDILSAIVRLREAGCDLHVEDAGLDTTSPVDRVLFRVAEALKTADDQAAAQRRMRRAGGTDPEPTPGQRSLIRGALASGMSPRQVAKNLKLPLRLVQVVAQEKR